MGEVRAMRGCRAPRDPTPKWVCEIEEFTHALSVGDIGRWRPRRFPSARRVVSPISWTRAGPPELQNYATRRTLTHGPKNITNRHALFETSSYFRAHTNKSAPAHWRSYARYIASRHFRAHSLRRREARKGVLPNVKYLSWANGGRSIELYGARRSAPSHDETP